MKRDIRAGRWISYAALIAITTVGLVCAMLAYPVLRINDDADALLNQPAAAWLASTMTPTPQALVSLQTWTLTPPTEPPLSAQLTPLPATMIPPTATPDLPPPPADAPQPPPQALAQPPPAGGNIPNRIAIPAIGLDAPVTVVGWHMEDQGGQQVSVWDVPHTFAAGWLKSSAPLGLAGNTVLEGHHNIYGEVFKNLVDLQPGDAITLQAPDLTRTYRVNEKLILPEAGQSVEVRQANAAYINPTSDERLTLVTCWPYTNNTHRLLIIAFPAEP